MGGKVKNGGKKLLWSMMLGKEGMNSYVLESCSLGDIEIEEVGDGDVNRDVKSGGRVSIGNVMVEKVMSSGG